MSNLGKETPPIFVSEIRAMMKKYQSGFLRCRASPLETSAAPLALEMFQWSWGLTGAQPLDVPRCDISMQ